MKQEIQEQLSFIMENSGLLVGQPNAEDMIQKTIAYALLVHQNTELSESQVEEIQNFYDQINLQKIMMDLTPKASNDDIARIKVKSDRVKDFILSIERTSANVELVQQIDPLISKIERILIKRLAQGSRLTKEQASEAEAAIDDLQKIADHYVLEQMEKEGWQTNE